MHVRSRRLLLEVCVFGQHVSRKTFLSVGKGKPPAPAHAGIFRARKPQRTASRARNNFWYKGAAELSRVLNCREFACPQGAAHWSTDKFTRVKARQNNPRSPCGGRHSRGGRHVRGEASTHSGHHPTKSTAYPAMSCLSACTRTAALSSRNTLLGELRRLSARE